MPTDMTDPVMGLCQVGQARARAVPTRYRYLL